GGKVGAAEDLAGAGVDVDGAAVGGVHEDLFDLAEQQAEPGGVGRGDVAPGVVVPVQAGAGGRPGEVVGGDEVDVELRAEEGGHVLRVAVGVAGGVIGGAD